MVSCYRSPETTAAIAAALESGCAEGNLEAAQLLYEAYRTLFVGYHVHKARSSTAVGRLGGHSVKREP